VILIIEIRNLLTHNRGVVNDVFVRRVKDPPWKLGERLKLEPETHEEFIHFLLRTAARIDDRALEKWQLPAVEMRVVEGGPDEYIGDADSFGAEPPEAPD
jgi:hypothetical protein